MVAELGNTEGSAPAVEPDWNAVRAEYEGSADSIAAIARRHGVTPAAVSWRVTRDLWTKRYHSGRAERSTLVDRMFRVLDRQIMQLEKQMTDMGDKEAALLGTMARTLEKLMELDAGAGGTKAKRSQSKDIKDLREKLAKRIDQLQGQ